MTRGRPFEKGNKFGHGRPKGGLNKKTLVAQKLFEEHSPKIMALAISKCPEDRYLLRMLAHRIVPQSRELPVKIGRLPMKTIEDLDRASEATLKKMASGKMAISEAQEVFQMIETRRNVLETHDLERRISAMEEASAISPKTPNS